MDEPLVELPLPDAQEAHGRLDGLAALVMAGGSAPALVTAAVVHGELLALRPFTTHNGLVARAAERIVLINSGLDPKSVCPAEVGHAELGRAAYLAALDGYVSGTPQGMAAWIAHCGRAVELGARESTAVCGGAPARGGVGGRRERRTSVTREAYKRCRGRRVRRYECSVPPLA